MAGFGRFGESVKGLESTRFFTWFHMTPSGETVAPGERAYRPSGEAFRDLVLLTARTGPRDRLEALTLQVARGFIADRRQGAFARDVVKSFIENLGRGAAMESLVNEIFFGGGQMIMRGAPPAPPAEPSDPFRVFAGQTPRWAGALGGFPMTFANDASDEWFAIEVLPRERPGLFARLFGRRA